MLLNASPVTGDMCVWVAGQLTKESICTTKPDKGTAACTNLCCIPSPRNGYGWGSWWKMVSEESSFDDPVGKPGTDFSFPTKSPGGRGSRISRYFKVSSYNDVPHPEHPRPLLQRQEWTNLNGCFSKRIASAVFTHPIPVCVAFFKNSFPRNMGPCHHRTFWSNSFSLPHKDHGPLLCRVCPLWGTILINLRYMCRIFEDKVLTSNNLYGQVDKLISCDSLSSRGDNGQVDNLPWSLWAS